MTLKELQNASEDNLRDIVNQSLNQWESAGAFEKTHCLMQTQFFQRELEQRDARRIVRRDFILELSIIALILAEIVIAIVEGKEQAKILERQAVILERVEKAAMRAGNMNLVRP